MTSLKEKYVEILANNGIRNKISKVDLRGAGGLTGEHFASICEFVTVEFKNSEDKPLKLFVKNILPCANKKEMETAENIMVKEGTFLTTIVPEIQIFCQRKNTDVTSTICETLKRIFPKAYYADKKEIIMEDVASRGFRMLKKLDKHSFSTARVVLESLATYHAASYAWIKEFGGKFKILEKYPFITEIYDCKEVKEQTRLSLEPSFTTLLNMLKTNKKPGSQETYNKISKYRGKCMDTLQEAIYSPNTILDVLGHGDLWNNNMMFSNSMKDVIFIDFQVLRINSPNLDIVYYLLMSGSREARQRWKELLQIYYSKMKETVEALNETFDWTYEEFEVDFCKKSPMGLTMGLFMTIGMEAMEGYDINESDGFDATRFTDTINTWIAQNPIKAEEIVKTSCDLVEDFELICPF